MSAGRIGARIAGIALVLGGGAAACSTNDTGGTARCYQSPTSTLGRVPNDAGGVEVGPGWVRLDGASGADSGAATLVDSDGASLTGTWRQIAGDSVHLTAFNDFLRVELRALPSGAGLAGSLQARSDASLERDSTGQLREMNRRRELTARAVPCDSIPRVRNT